MANILIFGNSGAGKSTLAKHFARQKSLAHLDLDTIAWQPSSPPVRRTLDDSCKHIGAFTKENTQWVIEGCYADLLEIVVPESTQMVFLNLPIDACIENAKARPWEPHKYESKAAQDANLPMLLDWIKAYQTRTDTFSYQAHSALFDAFTGDKVMCVSNEQLF